MHALAFAAKKWAPQWVRFVALALVLLVAPRCQSDDGEEERGVQLDPRTLEQAIVDASSMGSNELAEMLGTGRLSLESLPLTGMFFLFRPRPPHPGGDDDFGIYGGIPKVDAILNSFYRSPVLTPSFVASRS